jgi:hypothetical protein
MSRSMEIQITRKYDTWQELLDGQNLGKFMVARIVSYPNRTRNIRISMSLLSASHSMGVQSHLLRKKCKCKLRLHIVDQVWRSYGTRA